MEELSNIMKVEKMKKLNWSVGKLHQECSLSNARSSNVESWPVEFLKIIQSLSLKTLELNTLKVKKWKIIPIKITLYKWSI